MCNLSNFGESVNIETSFIENENTGMITSEQLRCQEKVAKSRWHIQNERFSIRDVAFKVFQREGQKKEDAKWSTIFLALDPQKESKLHKDN